MFEKLNSDGEIKSSEIKAADVQAGEMSENTGKDLSENADMHKAQDGNLKTEDKNKEETEKQPNEDKKRRERRKVVSGGDKEMPVSAKNSKLKKFFNKFRFFKRFHIPITVKSAMIYAVMFLFFYALLTAYIIGTFRQQLIENGIAYEQYIKSTVMMTIALTAISVVVVTALGIIAGQAMMSPIRKMIKKIDRIGEDNLSVRLDDVDSQDELRELTTQINGMLSRMEESFSRQRTFISDASHELKTPISVIQGYADMLKRWGIDDRQLTQEGIDVILTESVNMKRIIEQLLFLAKIGRYMVNITEFDADEVMSDLAESYRMLHKDRTFMYKPAGATPLKTDKSLFIECVRAIADNAVKYSEEGSEIIFVLKKQEDGIAVSVRDFGQGISKEDLPHIFDRFYRCDKARGRGGNSSGLGLSIAKSVAETMGAKICVSSKLNEGSVFSIEFPTEKNE